MIKYLIQKEFLQIRRNAFLPRLIFAFPIMIMCVMPWVMNQEVKNIRVCIVDNDRSSLSQRLVHSIEQSRYFIFNGQQPSYYTALNEIEKSRSDIALVIPPKYSHDIALGHQPQVLIAANAVNGTKGSIGSSYLAQIVNNANINVNKTGSRKLSTLASHFSTLNLYNPHQNYKVFMIPALLAIVMMLMCGFLPALNIVGEKETGTIEQINVTPVSKWSFILAKLIPYWLIGLFIVTVCLLLAWGIYGITCQGPLWLVYLLAMLLALFFSSFGLIISNYRNTTPQATRSMPDWSYTTTYINPMHYFIDAVRTVFVRGGGLSSIAHQVVALTLFALIMGAWAVASYKKNN